MFETSKMNLTAAITFKNGSARNREALQQMVIAHAARLDVDSRVAMVTELYEAIGHTSSPEYARWCISRMGLGDYIAPVINVEGDWHHALGQLITDAKLEDVVLPVPKCRFNLKLGDVEYGVTLVAPESGGKIKVINPTVKLSSTSGTVKISSLGDVSAVLAHTTRMMNAVVYSLLATEMNLSVTQKEASTDANPSWLPKGVNPDMYRGDTYRVIQISKSFSSGRSDDSETRHGVRFHIRRAHWREYADGKRVRINWTFVGDITLGSVIKDYAI